MNQAAPGPSARGVRVVVVALVATLVTASLTAVLQTGARADPVAPAPASQAAAPAYRPLTSLWTTNPERSEHGISNHLVTLIDETPSGAEIDAMVYRLGSSRVVSALTAAYKRGVVVRIATAHSQENIASQSAKPLKTLLDHATNGSSFTWTQGSARGSSTADGAVMHIKAYTFSRVGTGSDIVFTGSYNTADGADAATFARMLQVVGNNNLYQDYHTIFVQVVANKPVHHPFRSFAGSGWTAYFLPDNPISKSNDPALKRLNSLPAKAKTTIKIAMYSMWGSRGTWLADRLATIAKKGGHVTLVAGPDVASNIVRILRKAGVNVQGGCFTNGDFDHGKDMAATYLTGSGKSAKRVYWAWVGSDNWGTTSDDNDEATLGVQSKSLEDALASSIQTTANTGHSVSPGSKSCHPNPKG